MARSRFGSDLNRELLRLLRPHNPRLEQQVSEQVRPQLAAVGRSHSGRPSAEIAAALESVVRSAGAEPDRAAIAEFADDISRGENPFD